MIDSWHLSYHYICKCIHYPLHLNVHFMLSIQDSQYIRSNKFYLIIMKKMYTLISQPRRRLKKIFCNVYWVLYTSTFSLHYLIYIFLLGVAHFPSPGLQVFILREIILHFPMIKVFTMNKTIITYSWGRSSWQLRCHHPWWRN